MWFVYALYNRKNKKFYIERTNNIERRLSEHNKKSGNHYTSRFDGEWVLIYKEQAHNKQIALERKIIKEFQRSGIY